MIITLRFLFSAKKAPHEHIKNGDILTPLPREGIIILVIFSIFLLF